MGARFDQHRTAVHDRVAVIVDAIFRRHVIIGDAVLGQNGADGAVLVDLSRRGRRDGSAIFVGGFRAGGGGAGVSARRGGVSARRGERVKR